MYQCPKWNGLMEHGQTWKTLREPSVLGLYCLLQSCNFIFELDMSFLDRHVIFGQVFQRKNPGFRIMMPGSSLESAQVYLLIKLL